MRRYAVGLTDTALAADPQPLAAENEKVGYDMRRLACGSPSREDSISAPG